MPPDLQAAPADAARAFIALHGDTRLGNCHTVQDRSPMSLHQGHVALLVDYTQEDREAKGLRKLAARDSAPPPVPDTVFESAGREPLLLLSGPSGCGKSTSLLYLGLTLAGSLAGDARWALPAAGRPVVRNTTGQIVNELWHGPAAWPLPVLVQLNGPTTLTALLAGLGDAGRDLLNGNLSNPELLIIDDAQTLGDSGPSLLQDLAALAGRLPVLRVLVAIDDAAARLWPVPAAYARRRIVGLIAPQRERLCLAMRPEADATAWEQAGPEVLQHAGLYTLAVELGDPAAATAQALVDGWLDSARLRHAEGIDAANGDDRLVLQRPFVQQHQAARRLSKLPAAETAAHFASDPLCWMAPVAIAAQRLAAAGDGSLDALLNALLSVSSTAAADLATLTAARALCAMPTIARTVQTQDAIRSGLLRIVAQGHAPAALRDEVGRALATLGDPRDLDELVGIAGGPFTMGSDTHPNSAPVHVVALRSYRIGRYPVTNGLYLRFTAETGRPWRSRDGLLAERTNAPAVDLSWHDARACCAWLTARWRAACSIGQQETVRLPTEPEWERAARGVRVADALVFPWPGAWHPDHANAEEAGLNDSCAVGLFPQGRSPDGCDDMAGQVWEWTSTLWGEDTATPRFKYPYADDGREAAEAPADVRRVLRGACFVSPREKANCTYRGSLEPDGCWRGNGFRVVVAAE